MTLFTYETISERIVYLYKVILKACHPCQGIQHEIMQVHQKVLQLRRRAQQRNYFV